MHISICLMVIQVMSAVYKTYRVSGLRQPIQDIQGGQNKQMECAVFGGPPCMSCKWLTWLVLPSTFLTVIVCRRYEILDISNCANPNECVFVRPTTALKAGRVLSHGKCFYAQSGIISLLLNTAAMRRRQDKFPHGLARADNSRNYIRTQPHVPKDMLKDMRIENGRPQKVFTVVGTSEPRVVRLFLMSHVPVQQRAIAITFSSKDISRTTRSWPCMQIVHKPLIHVVKINVYPILIIQHMTLLLIDTQSRACN